MAATPQTQSAPVELKTEPAPQTQDVQARSELVVPIDIGPGLTWDLPYVAREDQSK